MIRDSSHIRWHISRGTGWMHLTFIGNWQTSFADADMTVSDLYDFGEGKVLITIDYEQVG